MKCSKAHGIGFPSLYDLMEIGGLLYAILICAHGTACLLGDGVVFIGVSNGILL